MATTLTRYLKLKVADDLSADAKYNLNRLDTLGGVSGATFSVDSTDNLNVRSRGDIVIEPQSPDVGGSNSGGLVQLGVTNHLVEVLLLTSSFKVNSSLSLKHGATAYYLSLSPVSTASANSTITLDTVNLNRSIKIDGDGTLARVNATGTTQNILEISGLTTALSVGQGGTGSTTAAAASFSLLGGLTNNGPSKALRINAAGTALEWFSVTAGGTVTSVTVDVSAVPELSVSGSPITSSGTFTLTKVAQAANKIYASPTSGSGLPEFRSLAKSDLPVLTTTDIGEGTNLYFTEGRAQSAVVVTSMSAGDSTHSPSSQTVLTALGSYQLLVTPGTAGQYWTGAKSFADLNVAAVSGLQTALDAKYSTTNPANYIDAAGAATVVAAGKVVANWEIGDGLTKTVTHGLGTNDVTVEIYDESGATIYVDSVVRTAPGGVHTVTLTSSSTPPGTVASSGSWRVLIRS